MHKTREDLFIEAFDAKEPIINDDGLLTDSFTKKLDENGIDSSDRAFRFVFSHLSDYDESVVNEHCNSLTFIFHINKRFFELTFLDNHFETYAAELYEVVPHHKVITVYNKL